MCPPSGIGQARRLVIRYQLGSGQGFRLEKV